MVVKDWKTTAAGILSAVIATVGPLTAYLATLPNQGKATAIAGVVTLVGAIARVWLGMIQHDAPPADSVTVTTSSVQNVTKVGILIFLALCLSPLATAQVQPPAPVDPDNLYFAGVSYSQGATPSTAGTAMYDRKIADNNGFSTYAFTMVDLIPASVKPFTVSTNIGAGVAQKVATIANIPIYVPTAAGISLNGNNVGWVWSTGAGAPFEIKRKGESTHFYVMPTVRINKASIGNSGYQPIVGVLFGWGQ